MLVIVNGSETIGSRKIAARINDVLNKRNSIKIDGYTVDITGDTPVIYDVNNNLVYGGDVHSLFHNEDGSESAEGMAVFNKAVTMKENTFYTNRHIFDKHIDNYRTEFTNELQTGTVKLRILGDIVFDYEFDDPDFDNVKTLADQVCDLLVEFHNNSNDLYTVVSGSFSALYLNKLKSLLGSSNIAVINITRNPSVSYITHFTGSMPDNFYETSFNDPEDPWSPRTFDVSNAADYPDEYCYDYFCSLVNSATVKNFEGVIDCSFEDLLQDPTLVINGIDVDLSPVIKAHNKLITESEFTELTTELSLTEANMSAANAFFTDMRDWKLINDIADGNVFPDANSSPLPANIFTLLNYSPLTISNITK